MSSYQVSIEDIAYAEKMAGLPGRTAFIDECGSFGFDFDKDNISTHYIICAIVVNNDQIPSLEKRIDETRKSKFSGSEMTSSSIGSNHKRRANLLTELVMMDFSVIILIANKQKFYKDSPLTDYKTTFVKYLHRCLYDSMYCAYPKLKIIEDEYGSSEFQKGYREYVRSHRPTFKLFDDYDFDYVDSKASNIVQIADIIAGSVMQHILDEEAPDLLKLFQSHIRDVIHFPTIFPPREEKEESDNYYDAQIYNLVHKCAFDYIEKHKDDESEEVRLRVLFLRFLLFKCVNHGEKQYIYSGEIVRDLSAMSDSKVIKDFLCRRIVAKLRDEGGAYSKQLPWLQNSNLCQRYSHVY